jgi:pyruvate/2-oxoglutarate dehydrogenase complex dihydrolipoamide acyltransferase (E2) component
MFMVVMFAALVGMLFFGSWQSMRPKVTQWLSWILPQWFPQPGNQVVGTIGGQDIRDREAREFLNEMNIAGRASETWAMMLESRVTAPEARARAYRYTVGATVWPIVRESLAGDRRPAKDVLVWMALYREARAAGFDASQAQAQDRVKGVVDLGLPQASMDRMIAELTGGSRDLFLRALRTDMTLRAYAEYLAETLGGAVTPEARREFIKMDDRIQVRLAVLKADEFLSQVKDVPEAEVKQQFEKYKQYLPGKGPDGYGYRIPDRVSVEYLVAEPKAFEDQVKAKVADADVERYYENHKDPEFLVKEDRPEAARPQSWRAAPQAPAASEKPAPAKDPDPAPAKESPAGAKGDAGPQGPVTPPEPKAEAKPAAASSAAPAAPAAPAQKAAAPAAPVAKPPEKKFRPLQEVQDEIRKRLVQEQAAAMARELLLTGVAEIRPMKKPPDLRIWADGKKIRFVPATGLLTAAQLAALPGLGKASRGQEAFPETALALSELIGPEKAKLGRMETSEPFAGQDGEAFAFRVTAFQANHEPASLEEVKDQVIADLKRAKAFEIAREQGRQLLDQAEKKGLKDAADALKVKTADSDWVSRERFISFGGQVMAIPASLPEVGADRAVVSECFRMAMESKKLTLVSLAEEKRVVVAELLGRKMPREALFERLRPALVDQVRRELGGKAFREAISVASIERRMGVAMKVGDDYFISRVAHDYRVPED